MEVCFTFLTIPLRVAWRKLTKCGPNPQLLNQMDGFDSLGRTKLIMATNRPDTLDPALLRPGRLDRKIEVPLPNEQARLEILKIHSNPVNKHGDIDYEAIVKLTDAFNGADLRNVVTEAGMFAIRDDRWVVNSSCGCVVEVEF